MVSTLTTKNASIAIEALTLGAVDYIEKPDSKTIASGDSFQKNLISKIKNIAKENNNNNHITLPSINDNSNSGEYCAKQLSTDNIIIRADREINIEPKIFAIASSTGGPKAINDLLIDFGAHYLANKIIIVTQHMPALFIKLFAESLNKLNIIKCQEASDGEILTPGNLYIAPGNKHMRITENKNKKPSVILDDGPTINFCKPSADPMIESAAKIFKNEMITIVLTGIGKDALHGSQEAVNLGSIIIAQDKNSSIVWGMPGNVAVNNICSAVLPLNKIAPFIIKKGQT